MTSMQIAFHSPSLEIFGGGEKYFLTALAEALDITTGEICLLSPTPPRPSDWHRMLEVEIPLDRLRWIPASGVQVTRASGNLDLLVTNMTYQPVSHALRSIALIQVPPQPVAGLGLRDVPKAYVRRQRHRSRLKRYELICNSRFTEQHVNRLTGRNDTRVIYPPIDPPAAPPARKEQIILSVARFFPMKRQDLLIDAFRQLRATTPEISAWELHLVGVIGTRKYMSLLTDKAADLPIYFHGSAPRSEVISLYRRASIFWHGAGFDAPAHDPAQMEHFGMTTAEAMGYGCVPVVINCGGQPEIVTDGVDGYLWSTVDQLLDKTKGLVADPATWNALAGAARRSVARFDTSRFRQEVRELLSAVGSESSTAFANA